MITVGVLMLVTFVIGWVVGSGVQFSCHWPWKKQE